MANINIKFDERIKDISNIQSLIHFDEKYIGKSGYFSDVLYGFQDLNDCHQDTLLSISTDDGNSDSIFKTEDGFYRFFLPEELVKKSKKKYRPFSLEEFLKKFKIGDVVIYRMKGSTIVEHKMFIGYENKIDGSQDNDPGACDVILGGYFGLKYLFDEYEWFFNGRWQPFGIEE